MTELTRYPLTGVIGTRGWCRGCGTIAYVHDDAATVDGFVRRHQRCGEHVQQQQQSKRQAPLPRLGLSELD